MSNVNSVVVSGNLTRDPEVRWMSADGESAIAATGVAVNRSRYNKETEKYEDEVSFFDIDVFGGYAKVVARKLRKGDSVTVQGRLEQQSYEKDGEKHSSIKIIATAIDSDGLFRPKEEDRELAVGGTQTEAPAATEAPTDDDIPF